MVAGSALVTTYLNIRKTNDDASINDELKKLIDDLHKQQGATEATNRILYVAADGLLAWGKTEVYDQIKAFQKQGAEIKVVGDGSSNINEKLIYEAAESISGDDRPITVVFMSHGHKNTENGHELYLSYDFDTVSATSYNTCALMNELDSILSREGASVSFFIESCYAGAAIAECGKNIGSDIVTLAPSNAPVSASQFTDFSAALKKESLKDLSAASLLELYLAHTGTMGLHSAPPHFSKNGVAIDTSKHFYDVLGVPLDKEEKITYIVP